MADAETRRGGPAGLAALGWAALAAAWIGPVFVVAPGPREALAAAQAKGAASYYVAPNGLDSNPGTLEKPFQTVQKAAIVATAGDTVYLRAGTYRETIVPAHSGKVNAPIIFQ